MEIDVGAYIADLLYDHDVVNLPGLGSFTGKYQPANIDHVQGKLYPPAKELAFNANLVLDDGVLVQYIQRKHQLSVEEAQRLVEDFVRKVRETLNNKEIVVLPKIGRLFRDYEGQLKFVAEGANFNTDSFGLPAVQFFPVRRLADQAAPPANASVREEKTTPAPKTTWVQNFVDWFDRHILYFIGATALFIIFVIYWFFVYKTPDQDPVALEPNTPEVPGERFNISPSQNDEIGVTVPEEEQPANDQNSGVDTEEPTAAPGQRSAVIQVGIFGNPDNVERLVQKIYQAGFEPYTSKSGNLTTVGVQFAYQTESDLQRTLRDVQSKFESKAKIIQR
jgi:nucleoid DNA-binding protein/cell division septation protein DedD